MPALQGDGYVSCPKCHSLYVYRGSKPDPGQVETRCRECNNPSYTLDQRISYAVHQGWQAYREYFDEEGRRPPR